ncbi:speckle-type POZ protein-like [Trichogramma pretiosum]|uniref:speckle-type POZ protein-like n=1 Tax=Trichogramma pretiosum TaxID=7493 RepID=UPI000C7193AB|nr:speckle-type POZ protein-like [Trichogramma pretiosum]
MSSKQIIEASTKIYSGECIYTWTIENYRLIKFKVGEVLESPKFGVGSDDKKYFQLLLYPEGARTEDAGYISLFLKPVIDPKNKPLGLVCRWTVSAINGEEVIKKSTLCHDFAGNQNFLGYGCPKFLKVENIDQLISSQNTITFHCELEILGVFESSLNSDIMCSEDETIDTIKFDFSFDNEKLSDVKLIVEEEEIPAHKIILAAVSPVFRVMFTNDTLENKENLVKITDTNKNIVKEMLRFIYTGKIDVIETDMIIELLVAADKYKIDSLKNKCAKMLCDD